MSTAYERWKDRTNDGQAMAAGWHHAKHTPPRAAQYEVRGAEFNYLTWAYDSWWHQDVGGPNSGAWTRIPGRYAWKPYCEYCSVNWGHVVHQAAEAGNAEAIAEIEAAKKRWNERVKAQTATS